jgi:cytosine/adenosine deaminase-related metal-dependent hydrolase
LEVVADTAATLDCPVHVHVSEQRAEQEACLAEHGMTPTQLLNACGLLNDAATAIHGTHLTGNDMKLLAESGAGVCFCPTTERELGDGIGPARELRDLGVPLSFGTDSNAVVDLFEEARSLELNDRLRLELRGIHSPVDLLHSATTTGLAALGWGTHEPLGVGSPADFLCVGAGVDTGTFEASDGLGAFLFSGQLPVTDVVVGGRHVVKEGLNQNGQSISGLGRAIRGFLQ